MQQSVANCVSEFLEQGGRQCLLKYEDCDISILFISEIIRIHVTEKHSRNTLAYICYYPELDSFDEYELNGDMLRPYVDHLKILELMNII